MSAAELEQAVTEVLIDRDALQLRIEELGEDISNDYAGRDLLLIGPFVGFFGTGYFSLFGATLAELYPTAIRGAGQGFTYNFGRGLSALAPYLVGVIADSNGLGTALLLNSAFFLIAAGLVFTLPETKATALA